MPVNLQTSLGPVVVSVSLTPEYRKLQSSELVRKLDIIPINTFWHKGMLFLRSVVRCRHQTRSPSWHYCRRRASFLARQRRQYRTRSMQAFLIAFTNAIVNSLQDSGHIFDSQDPFLQQVRPVLPYFYKLQRKIELMVETEIDKGVVRVHAQDH